MKTTKLEKGQYTVLTSKGNKFEISQCENTLEGWNVTVVDCQGLEFGENFEPFRLKKQALAYLEKTY